jgi:hypothetical protein
MHETRAPESVRRMFALTVPQMSPTHPPAQDAVVEANVPILAVPKKLRDPPQSILQGHNVIDPKTLGPSGQNLGEVLEDHISAEEHRNPACLSRRMAYRE